MKRRLLFIILLAIVLALIMKYGASAAPLMAGPPVAEPGVNDQGAEARFDWRIINIPAAHGFVFARGI